MGGPCNLVRTECGAMAQRPADEANDLVPVHVVRLLALRRGKPHVYEPGACHLEEV